MPTLRRAILADLVHYTVPKAEALERLAELEELTKTYGGVAVVRTVQRRAKPDNRTYIGSGKVEEIVAEGKLLGADLLIINEVLKPQQIFNLEELLRGAKIQVWDRIDLILNIFDKHAKTSEAKLEIELARLRHMGPRIFNMGAELGRQRGGRGTVGGSGEGNTEAMKRHLREQEKQILQKLEKCQSVRDQHQQHRRRQEKKTVALVGYTNAGKTSLLNALGKRQEYAADKLFATLDTRVADVYIPELNETILLSDTIGFIAGLPPQLIRAFHSTLSEAANADLLLQVVDVADPKYVAKMAVVDDVLQQLNIADHPRLIVYNKIDAIKKPATIKKLLSTSSPSYGGVRGGVVVSAHAKTGLIELKTAIAKMFSTT